ncbi:MAG: hypothetical protein IJS71_04625 [Clostridia bacterium]|nr:hypothetical protein [Clostridia bacterium]
MSRSRSVNVSAILTAILLALAFVLTSCVAVGPGAPDETVPPKDGESREAVGYSYTVKDGVATVTMKSGEKYTATGFSEASSGSLLTVEKEFMARLDGAGTDGEFNRIVIGYSSTGPFEILVKYEGVDGGQVSEKYYLEKGEDRTFSGIVSSYLEGGTGRKINEITARPLAGTSKFLITNVSVETIPTAECDSDGNYYIENDRYRLGVRLAWGGGISYIFDKNCKVPGVANLINQHDTGRLVQQSYYGTGPIEGVYDPGEFLGNVWMYNPVQGGDRFGTASRLIDVSVKDGELYVKCQPKDWGNDDLLLPCYMENTYKLFGDRIQVDNRFVDFSGYDHPYQLQELPAFYTISYLDTLVYYNGREPWTDAGLTVKSDITDWTTPENTGQNRFEILRGNTETWAAFVNLEDDFGIGLYTPNYEVLNAGRYKFNGTKDSKDDPANYIAPRSELKIESYRDLEYSYLIASGSVEEMRGVFKANKDFTFNPKLTLWANNDTGTDEVYDFTGIDFTKQGTEKLFYNLHNTLISYDEDEGCVRFDVTEGYDVYCGLSIDNNALDIMKAEDYPVLEIEYMIPKTDSKGANMMELFLSAGNVTTAAAENSVFVSWIPDGKFHKVRINLTSKEVWSGEIHNIRIDYFTECVAGDVFYIKSLGFRQDAVEVSPTSIDFTKEEGISAIANTVRTAASYDEKEKAARLDVIDGNDVNVSFNLSNPGDTSGAADPLLEAGNYTAIEIEYMVPASNRLSNYRLEIYLCAGEVKNPTEENCARAKLVKDGEYHTVTVPMSAFKTNKGRLLTLRFDYFAEAAAGDVLYVKSFRFVP